jgi:hypothetical protein
MENYCRKCGAPRVDGDRFCHKCGSNASTFLEQGVPRAQKLPGRLHRLCISALVVWTALWIGLTFAYVALVSDAANNSTGAMVGMGLGLGMYGFFWFLPSVVLGIIAVATRPSPSVSWPRWTTIITVLSALAVFLCPFMLHLSSLRGSDEVDASAQTSAVLLHEVKYVVDAGQPEYTLIYPSKATLTYRNETGGTEQTSVVVPWELKMKCPRGSFLYISAQKGQEPWDHVPRGVKLWHNKAIHVAVYVDGHILQQAESTAAYGVASASGQVPSM